jgi:hypothetical protein
MAWVGLVALLALLFSLGQGIIPGAGAPGVQAQPPTVNGLYWGDGDHEKYQLYNTSYWDSKLYAYLDGTTLYAALVVDRSVNDNVFDKGVTQYMKSADWNNRPASNLVNSEYAGFTLTCAGTTYVWQQSYAYRGANNLWVSDHLGGAGAGTPPAGIQSTSSFAWNINHYEAKAPGDRLWNMYVNGTALGDWKSPWVAPGNYVPGLDGYPLVGQPVYSSQFQYEWPMVYEWRTDLSIACSGSSVYVFSGSSHHSPSKVGLEDDEFPPNGGTLKDFGDLPNSYKTLLADNGPYHEIIVGGIVLGATIDAEVNGQPSDDAMGDDNAAVDDEDGVALVNPSAWFEGAGGGSVDVTFSGGGTGTKTAWLAIWFDWNHDGVFTAGEASVYTQVTWTGDSDTQRFTFDIPTGINALGNILHYRACLFTSEPALGTGAFVGGVVGGEIEDYRYEAPTAVNLLPLTAIGANGSVALFWETTSEIDNLGFNLYRATQADGPRAKINAALIPSLVAPGSPFGAAYEYMDTAVKNDKTYYYWLEDLDIYGKTQLHGPVEVSVGGWLTGKGALPPIKR